MDFLKFKNQSDIAELLINGDIVDDSYKWFYDAIEDVSAVFPSDVWESLKTIDGQELHVHINSGGGSVFAGVAIANYLKNRNGRTIAYIDGLAASIASVIACACDEVVIPSNAFFMIHKPMCGVKGNADELRKLADTLDVIQDGILQSYESKKQDGIDLSTINDLVNQETWFTGAESTQYFKFNTTEALDAVACVGDLAQEFFYAHNLPCSKVEAVAEDVAEEVIVADVDEKRKEIEVYLAMKGVKG